MKDFDYENIFNMFIEEKESINDELIDTLYIDCSEGIYVNPK